VTFSRASASGEGGAASAGAEVRAKCRPLFVGEVSCSRFLDDGLGLLAGERLVELFAEGSAGAGDQCVDRRG
jgi:hypothetical protein